MAESLRSTNHSRLRQAEELLSISSEHEALDLDSHDTVHRAQQRAALSSNWKQHVIFKLWRRHVSMAVPVTACRDHLANERTALGWIRTSQVFAMMGVFISQLLRIQHAPNPSKVFGYYVVSLPLATICNVIALMVSLIGAHRFFRWQKAMTTGKAMSGGWEVLLVALLSLGILLTIFCVHIGIDAFQRSHHDW